MLILDMQEKKIKWHKRGTKNNMASKIVKKKKFWTHMMEMIPFYLLFPNVVGFWVGVGGGEIFAPRAPFPHIYFLQPEIIYNFLY